MQSERKGRAGYGLAFLGQVAVDTFHRVLDDESALRQYMGLRTKVMLQDGRAYVYDAQSTLGDDGEYVLEAVGRNGGRWLLITTDALSGIFQANLTKAQLRVQKRPTSKRLLAVNILDKGFKGLFILDPNDHVTPDDEGLVLVDAVGNRYKRFMNGEAVNAREHFDVRGDGIVREQKPGWNEATDWSDTKGLQLAALAVARANDPHTFNVTNSPATRFSNTLKIPHGIFRITEEIPLRGSMTVEMDAANSYGGTRIQQVGEGQHIFHQYADTDGVSSAVSYVHGILRGGVGSHNVNTAAIYCGNYVPTAEDIYKASLPTATKWDIWKSWGDGNGHSTRIYYTWFQGNESYAGIFKRGDDIVLNGVTLDVQAWNGFFFGSDLQACTNLQINGGTFYDVRAGVIQFYNVDGFIVNNVRNYTNNPTQRTPYFIEAGGGKSVRHGEITGCVIDSVDKFIRVDQACYDLHIHHNHHFNGKGRSVEIGGGASPDLIRVTDNTFEGDYSGTVTLDGITVPDAPIFVHATSPRNSEITRNTIRHTGPGLAETPILVNHLSTVGNTITNNPSIGFKDKGQIVNGLRNRTVQVFRVHTKNWDSTITYKNIVPGGVMEHFRKYTGILRFQQPGQAIISQTFEIGGMACFPNAPAAGNPINTNYSNYNGDSSHFNLISQRGPMTFGIGGAPSRVIEEGKTSALDGVLEIVLQEVLTDMDAMGTMAAPAYDPSGIKPPTTTPTNPSAPGKWRLDTTNGPSQRPYGGVTAQAPYKIGDYPDQPIFQAGQQRTMSFAAYFGGTGPLTYVVKKLDGTPLPAGVTHDQTSLIIAADCVDMQIPLTITVSNGVGSVERNFLLTVKRYAGAPGTEYCQDYRKITPQELDNLGQARGIYEYNTGQPRAFNSREEVLQFVPNFNTPGNPTGLDFCGCTSQTCEEGATLYNSNYPDHIASGDNPYWPATQGWYGFALTKPTASATGSVTVLRVNLCGKIINREVVTLYFN